MKSGYCKANFRMWYHFNGYCQEFVYGGCAGNDNRFRSREECEFICQATKSTVTPCEPQPQPTGNVRYFKTRLGVQQCKAQGQVFCP